MQRDHGGKPGTSDLVRRPVQVGVIGVGNFGENHVRAYSESPLSELVAVADVDGARAATIAERYGVRRSYTDYSDLLREPDLEAVSIATPAEHHAAPAIAAAAAGKHILLEKPMATTLADAEAICKAARRNRVKVMIGQMLRFEAHCASIQSAIQGGAMGRPVAIISRWNNPITEARRSGGNVSLILHVMIHSIDLSLWYMDQRPQRVFCTAARGKVYAEMGVPDGCVLTIEFDQGGVAVTESFWCLPEEFANWSAPQDWNPLVSDTHLEVICTEGVMYLGSPISSLRACGPGGWRFPQVTFRPIVHGELSGALREEIRHFLTCCRSEQQPLAGVHDGLASLQVALAAQESLRTGLPVSVEAAPDSELEDDGSLKGHVE